MEPNFEAEARKLLSCIKQLPEKMTTLELIASMQKMYQLGKDVEPVHFMPGMNITIKEKR